MSQVKAMCLVPGGSFLMGSADFYPEERPLRQVEVADLWVDAHPVTNAQFRRFVQDSGHVTVAERAPDPDDFPGADPDLLVAGSQVFVATAGPVALDDWTRWWAATEPDHPDEHQTGERAEHPQAHRVPHEHPELPILSERR
jgi:sulfatase modifying factor 1